MTPLHPKAVDRLLANTEPWLSCDDCFEQLDVAVEAALGRAGPLPAAIRVHLAACPVCSEEARSLAALVAGDHGLTPAEALAELDAAVAAGRTRTRCGARRDER